MKLLELHYEKNADGEQYVIKTEKGVSKIQAAAHLFKAVAEGLTEIQMAFLPITDMIEQENKASETS